MERVATAKSTDRKKANHASAIRKTAEVNPAILSIGQVLYLHKTIGNQAVQKLFKSGVIQPKLKISPPNDISKQEADRVKPAAKVSTEVTSQTKTTSESMPKESHEAKPSRTPHPADGRKLAVVTRGGKRKGQIEPSTEKEGKGEAKGAPAAPEAVSMTGEDPGQILEKLKNVPPTSAVDAYNQAQKASVGALERQKQQVEQTLPEIPAPTGLPSKESYGEKKGIMVLTPEKAPSSLESEKSGKRREEYRPQVEEAPPPSPVKPTVLSSGEAEDSSDTKLSQSAQNALEDTQLDTSQISTSAGECPAVDITGEADPSQVDSFQSVSENTVQNAKTEASKRIYQDFGGNDIFPEPTDETLKASKALSSPKIPSGKGGESPSIPVEAISGLNKSLGPKLRERIGEEKEEYDRGKDKFDIDAANARADADQKIADLNKEASQIQIDEQNKAKADVAQLRVEWQSELDSVEQDYQEKASRATEEHREKIAEEKRKGEENAAKQLDDAEKKAEQEKLKAENDAKEKKEKAKKESKGFWGWVRSAASAFIDSLKKAVNLIYDNLRKAVKQIFEAAKVLVKAAIELARMTIVGLIKGFGVILKGLVSVAFAAFPNIARKINRKIDKAVNVAVKGVNKAAEYLKKGVEAVLDFLAKTLDKLLGWIQSIYNGVFTVIGMIIRGEFGELMERIGSLVSSAKQMPDHFWGQVSEELLGMNLAEPLPFERTRAPKSEETATGVMETGALPLSDIDLLERPHLSENDITVDNIEKMELDPAFVAKLNLQEGEELEFGESTDQSRSVGAIKAEMLGTASTVQVADSTGEEGGKTASAKTQEEIAEEELQDLMAQEPKGGYTKEKQGEPAKEGDVPEHMKRGPFTAGQRARYLVHQMKIGIKQWFECNWPWLLAGAILAFAGGVVLTILTGGAFLSALPIIMELVGAIMIGVAIARVTSYVGDYLSQGWAGSIVRAAKSLARGLAVGAIELVFALLFNLGAVIKSLKSGLKATAKAAAKAAKATVTTAIKNVKELGRLGVQAGKAVIKNGKLVMKGLKGGFAKGAKSLDDLAKRLWQEVRFRKFKITLRSRRFTLWGYINPWKKLAESEIREKHPASKEKKTAEFSTSEESHQAILGDRRVETVEEFKQRGGIIQQVEPGKVPKKSPSEVVAVKEPEPPAELSADISDLASLDKKRAGVGLEEEHHIASKYDHKSKKMFEKAGLSMDDEINKISHFAEHGQDRGWWDVRRGYRDKAGKWIEAKFIYRQKGHHPAYKAWVNKLMWEGAPHDLTSEQAKKRIYDVLKQLGPIIRENPDVLIYGPEISPKLLRLKFDW